MVPKKIVCVSFLMFGFILTPCDAGSQPSAWRSLVGLRAKDYFAEEVQIRLAEASARGDVDQIAGLIRQGADVNATGREGMRPLFWAMSKGSAKGFAFLLENGADPNVTAESLAKNERPRSVMELAAIAEKSEFLVLALKSGGNPNFPVGYGERTILAEAILNNRTENVRVLIESGATIDHQDSGGLTPVLIAAGINNYDMVLFLLGRGADPKIRDRWGYDLAGMMKRYGDRGIKRNSEQYRWYLKTVAEMERRGLLDTPKAGK